MKNRMGWTGRLRAAGRVLLRGQLDAAGGGRRWKDDRRMLDAARVLHGDASTVAARAQAFVLNNGHGARLVEALVGNLVGTGIVPRSQHPEEATRRRLAMNFAAWTDDADADGVADHYGQQAALCRDMVTLGEGLGIWTANPVTLAPWLRRLHPEQLDRSKSLLLQGGGAIVQGVEFGAAGRVVAYWIRATAPGDSLAGLPLMSQRFPATDVLHVFRPLVPGQVRGISWLAPVLLSATDLAAVFDATIVRARVAGLFAGFLKAGETGHPLDGDVIDGEVTLEPGVMVNLNPGESVDFNDPPDPGNIAAAATEFLRIIAAGVGITYEMLTGDYSKVNYSSARAAQLEFRRFAEGIQHHILVFQLCRKVWDRFVRWQVLTGAVPAATYQRDRTAFLSVKWLPPAWSWIDPLKDAQAAVLEMNNLLRSRSEIAAERGIDIEQLDTEIAGDKRRADGLGLAPAAPVPITTEKPNAE